MEKIAIIVDSGADISPKLAKENGIYYLPLYVNIEGEFLKDRIDISPEEFYDYIEKENYLPKTSLPSPGDVINLLEKVRDDGYDKAIIICIGSNFSGTYNLCKNTEVDGIETFALDSKNLTMAEGFLAIYAKKLVDEGKSFEEIKDLLEKARTSSRVFFTLESFKYIIEGGRVPKTFGKLSDALSVKPLVTVNPEDGKFHLKKLVRGEKKILRQFYKTAVENLEGAKDYYMFISKGDGLELADKLEENLKEFISGAKLFLKDQISPTLGANTGPGLCGFAFFRMD